ncbi:flavin reductase family protein [Sphingobium chlorophenolicum]|uniref:Flavin reductase domain protein FMN-binding protein n=1 Tax=Sphingobium chlorophenolicum TaxID=46429 RepID=A0A081RF19_SPHCR|nr:flavin reductase family protein [Sphingobium chlorophenolicum]KEQ53792.1 Flavin reductase domain protein FMN-binding protein [Sphingobium chlorophenolicum]
MTTVAIEEDFKQAMRRLATTIALITSGRGDSWAGMAATAVTSIAGSPPTILISVNRNASLHPVVMESRRFCVNLLSERHRDLVGIFSGAKKGAERFESGLWTASDEGLPVLGDAVASLICSVVSTVDVATHSLFIGEVDRIANHPEIDPLIWVDGRFGSASLLE